MVDESSTLDVVGSLTVDEGSTLVVDVSVVVEGGSTFTELTAVDG